MTTPYLHPMSARATHGRKPRRRFLALALVFSLAAVGAPQIARATPGACASAIAKAADRYLQQRSAELARCADQALRAGDVAAADACGSAPATVARLAAFAGTLQAKIARACGGGDRTCGNADDEPLAAIGWGVGACPDLGGAGCAMPIDHCGSIAQCVACTTAAAGDLLAGSSARGLAPGTDPSARSCQRELAKASDRGFRAAARSLAACTRGISSGATSGSCPGPADGKLGVKLASLARQAASKICRACGGGDRSCDAPVAGLPGSGAGDDPAASAISTTPSCSDVVPPSTGVSCAAPLDDATAVVTCAGCVARFSSECATALAAPLAGAYPDSCRSSTTPPEECPGCASWSDPATWGAPCRPPVRTSSSRPAWTSCSTWTHRRCAA